MLQINEKIQIDESEFDWSYARSGGPGGQNVNKVSSKAILHWNIMTSQGIDQDIRERFMTYYKSRVTVDGYLVIMDQSTRDQARNRAKCLEKLIRMLHRATTEPTPRKKTRPSRSSQMQRVAHKRRTSRMKTQRKLPSGED